MDHIVYLNSSREIDQLLSGEKTIMARASMGKKRPYDKVSAGDMLFFTNGFNSKVKAMAKVKSALSSRIEKDLSSGIRKQYGRMLGPEPLAELMSKRYVILIELEKAGPIVPFTLSEDVHGSPGDWVIVNNIDDVIC